MKLIDYCNSTDRGGQTRLAKALSISPVLVCTWANGIRPIPVERCVQIEQVTEGAVTRKDLRPDDWQKIWPELIEKAAA